MNRRSFIKSAGLAATSAIAASALCVDHAQAKDQARDILNYHPRMRYRPCGANGIHLSALGYGMLRPPMLPGGKPDEERFILMVRHAIDHGVNYIDTAYVYLNGQSEAVTGKALANGYRDKVYLTSKSPWWLLEKPDDFEKLFDESRRRLDTDHIDFYHIHMLMHRGWREKAVPFKLIDKIEKLKAQGKIRFSGFSLHDGYPLFKKIVEANPDWNFCLLQHNILDSEYEAGLLGLNLAAANGMGVSIMEPLRAGELSRPPKEVREIYAAAPEQRHPVEWAFDYLWNKPEVSVVVSGMNSMEQVNDNLEYASRSRAGMLDNEDAFLLGKVARQYRSYPGVSPCTGCYNCVPCPQNVAIPYLLAMVNNEYCAMGDKKRLKILSSPPGMTSFQRGDGPSVCNECGECLPKCPLYINIPAELRRIADDLNI